MFSRFTSAILALCLSFAVIGTETACSSSQVQTTLNAISVQLPIVQSTVASISSLTNDPKLVLVLQTVETAYSVDAPLLTAAIAAYKSGTGKLSGVIAAAEVLASSINAQVLAANKVVGPGTEKQALVALAVVAAAVNGFALSLSAFGSSKTAQASYKTVAPLIPQEEKQKVAETYGYTMAEAQNAIGL